MEKSKRSHTVRMKHEDEYGINEDSNLSQSVRASNKEDSQRTTTLTDNKKERQRKWRIFNAWRLMHWHQLRSHVHQVFQVISHIVGMRSVIRVVNSIVVAVTIYSTFDSDANSLYRFTLRKRVFWGVVFTPPVGCSRPPSVANDPIETKKRIIQKIVKVARLRFYPKTGHNKFHHSIISLLHVSSFNDFLLIIMSSTRNHSIATNWRKNSMIGAIADSLASRMAWAWVVVHQNLGVDGLM